MSLVLRLHCNGHRAGQPCGALRSSSLGYSPYRNRYTDREHLAAAAGLLDDLREGWRRQPNGGDLCPYPIHDEDAEAGR